MNEEALVVKKLYLEGYTVQQLAIATKKSVPTIYQWLHSVNTPMRPKGIQKRKREHR